MGLCGDRCVREADGGGLAAVCLCQHLPARLAPNGSRLLDVGAQVSRSVGRATAVTAQQIALLRRNNAHAAAATAIEEDEEPTIEDAVPECECQRREEEQWRC